MDFTAANSRSNENRDPRFTLYFQSSQLTLTSVLEVPDLLLGLSGKRPNNLYSELIKNSPIIDARVCELTDRYSVDHTKLSSDRYQKNEKPIYLKAEINNKNRKNGEGTERSPTLRDIIRRRGDFENDDCGHILAKNLGGKMVHFNVFPQTSLINLGRIPYSRVWKWGLELMMSTWLTVQCRNKPSVRLQVKLLYNDTDYPDRPSSLMFWVQFFRDDDEDSDSEESDDEERAEETIAIEGEVVNSALEFTAIEARDLAVEIKAIIQAFRDCRAEANLEELKEFLKILIENLEEVLPEPENVIEITEPLEQIQEIQEMGSSRQESSWSVWDFVPIVGPIRTFGDAIACAKEGNNTGFVAYYAIGSATLLLDIYTLGTASIAINSACKLAVKEGAKQVTKSVLKGAAKGAVKQAAISATVGATIGGVTGGGKGAVKGLISGAVGGAVGGGLSGSAKGAVKASARAVASRAAKAAAENAMMAAENVAKDSVTQVAKEAAKQAAREAAKTAAKEATKGIAANELKELLAREMRNRAACGGVRDAVTEAAKVIAGR